MYSARVTFIAYNAVKSANYFRRSEEFQPLVQVGGYPTYLMLTYLKRHILYSTSGFPIESPAVIEKPSGKSPVPI